MADRIVVNTGPLLALEHAQVDGVIACLPLDFVAPTEVRNELNAGTIAGHEAIQPSWVRFVALRAPPSALAVSNLDEGEAAVIQLALDEGISLVCIDERKGRRAARAVGLRVTGTLGLLGRAKTLGLLPAVRPVVRRMLASGTWLDAELLARFYATMGE